MRPQGVAEGSRAAALDWRVNRSPPPWRRWRTRSRAARCIRWIETYGRVPSGTNAGRPFRLERFQRETLEEVLAAGVRTGGVQTPRGNGKSTLWAAVALWAVCDIPDNPLVPLVAHTGPQAVRTLLWPIRRMVNLAKRAGVLEHDAVVVYASHSDRRIWSPWNDGQLLVLPAEVDSLQGLNPAVALVDEAQTMGPDVFAAVQQGAGKRAESLVLAIGSPAPGATDSALYGLRTAAAAGAKVAWVEHAAPAGCELDDRGAWAQANPGLAAGILHADVFDVELRTVTEAEFRAYRLGQWTDGAASAWLPPGAWDACPLAAPPPDGTEIVLGLAGTWASSVALVGCTLDGAVFLAWSASTATDDELRRMVDRARDRWQVVAIVAAPRIRGNLVAQLEADGAPVEVWPNRLDVEVGSATEWRRAIVERRVAHDHDPLLAEHVDGLVAVATSDGNFRLAAPADGRNVDAARAARMAWWRAAQLAAAPPAPVPAIY